MADWGVAGVVGVAGRLAREVVRLGQDRLGRSAIPQRVEDLDAPFMSAVLGRPVTAVEVLDRTDGTTDRVRLALQGEDVPPSVFVKMAPAATVTRLFADLADLGADEVRFYRDLRPGLAIEAPRAHAIGFDPRTKRFVVVLEDLTARGATFGDVLATQASDEVGRVLDVLASLHGQLWQTERLGGGGDLSWIRANSTDPVMPAVTLAVRRLGRRLADRDPALVARGGARILERYSAVARVLDAGPHTVLHGDPHPGNCYVVDGRTGLLDWQVVRRGVALRDVAYSMVLALEPEVRARHEHDLLDRYRDSLAAAGGPQLSASPTWATYRRMVAYPYVATTFTAGLGGLQDDEVGLAGLRRSVAAVEDLDTAAALDSVLS
jgi:hypothetical protein